MIADINERGGGIWSADSQDVAELRTTANDDEKRKKLQIMTEKQK